jgi:hypothetical protein
MEIMISLLLMTMQAHAIPTEYLEERRDTNSDAFSAGDKDDFILLFAGMGALALLLLCRCYCVMYNNESESSTPEYEAFNGNVELVGDLGSVQLAPPEYTQ